ncbi:MAG: hypothetical protein FOGNACKC_02897 [Anaerolineae bacterium]|nr:hypothetical protein [Anaerolineae bacterium]
MTLTELRFPHTMDTSSSNLIDNFFAPALGASIHYDRGVGFFSSGWLRIAAKGMVKFAANGGRSRWVTSPILDQADWEALKTGDAARYNPVLREALERNIIDLVQSLEKDTLSALAWMIADEILTFKLALPRNKLERGDFHDKFGIFTDVEGNHISFNGSYNDSVQGTRNYEAIKIFSSWEDAFAPLVQADMQRFERLWSNMDPNVQVFNLPEVTDKILDLRQDVRPYPEPKWIEIRRIQEGKQIYYYRSFSPAVPSHVTLRDYQVNATNSWFMAGCRGIFEMATGTGKTITALSAAARLYNQKKRIVLIISCPYKHLVEQWATEALQFGFRPIRVAESRTRWAANVAQELRAFQKQYVDIVTLVTTNKALQKGVLQELLEPFWSKTLLVMDEVHYAGAPTMLSALPEPTPWRLGLSATPLRHYDEEGTEAIFGYFGDAIFRLPLEEVIGVYLTPYYYHPIPVEMTDIEFSEFCDLTRKLQRQMRGKDQQMTEIAQRIAIKRARVLNNSLAKLDWLRENIRDYSKLKHTLFYVGDKIFSDVTRLLGLEKHIRIHEFTHRQSSNEERQEILKRFATGNLQALVAMKCLDEGVDVPPTRTAYFLASSGSPREFVQRRGRVLRQSEDKEYATLYDLISIPPMEYIEHGELNPDYKAVQAAVRREYRRVKEFASLAINRYQALDHMFGIADRLNVLDA